jgi:LysR family nitrogen assimilation transcriptional regulator
MTRIDAALLNSFLRVAESGSLTRAAAIGGESQSTLSKRIAVLEQMLRGRLFERTGRGLVLTEFGREALVRCRMLIDDLDAFTQLGSRRGTVPTGEVRVGIVPSWSIALAGRLFDEVSKRYPEVRLAIAEGYTDVLASSLARGDLDVALLNRYARADPPSEIALAEFDTYLVGRADGGAVRSETVPFFNLGRVRLMLPNRANELRRRVDAVARELRLTLNVALSVDSMPVMIDVLTRTDIHTLTTMRPVESLVRQGKLHAARVVRPTLKRNVVLALNGRHPANLAVRSVTRLLTTLAGEALGRAG